MEYFLQESFKPWIPLISIIIGNLAAVTIAVISWGKVHKLTAKRDIENSRRLTRVKELSDSYKSLVRCAVKGLHTFDDNKIDRTIADEVENAILTIHLYGTPQQSKLASKYSCEMAEQNSSDFTELVESLRKDIRAELGQGDVETKPSYFKYDVKKNN